jgi:hypothetical protein
MPRDAQRRFDHLRVEQIAQFLHVGAVRARQGCRQGHAPPISQEGCLTPPLPRPSFFAKGRLDQASIGRLPLAVVRFGVLVARRVTACRGCRSSYSAIEPYPSTVHAT